MWDKKKLFWKNYTTRLHQQTIEWKLNRRMNFQRAEKPTSNVCEMEEKKKKVQMSHGKSVPAQMPSQVKWTRTIYISCEYLQTTYTVCKHTVSPFCVRKRGNASSARQFLRFSYVNSSLTTVWCETIGFNFQRNRACRLWTRPLAVNVLTNFFSYCLLRILKGKMNRTTQWMICSFVHCSVGMVFIRFDYIVGRLLRI